MATKITYTHQGDYLLNNSKQIIKCFEFVK